MRQLHEIGAVQNHGQKAARQRREMQRFVLSVRKALIRNKKGVLLWVDRDYAQARAAGGKWLAWGPLLTPYNGWYFALGGRAALWLARKKA